MIYYEWRVNQTGSPSTTELQDALNTLAGEGFEIQSIFAVGHSVMVVARRRLQAAGNSAAGAARPAPEKGRS
jgi:hypothetical protein